MTAFNRVVIAHHDDAGEFKVTQVEDSPAVARDGKQEYYIDLALGAVAPPPEPYKSYKCSWDHSSEFGVVPVPPEGTALDTLTWLTDEQRDHIRQRWASDSECRNLALGQLRRQRAHLAQFISTYDEHKVKSLREELKVAEKDWEKRKKTLAGLDAIIGGNG